MVVKIEESFTDTFPLSEMFSLFNVVTFPNEQCTGASTTSSGAVYGTCYSSTECTAKSGSADGNCASGFGVCCTFL